MFLLKPTQLFVVLFALAMLVFLMFRGGNKYHNEDTPLAIAEPKKDTLESITKPSSEDSGRVAAATNLVKHEEEVVANPAALPQDVVKWSKEKHCKIVSTPFIHRSINPTIEGVNNRPKCHCLGAFKLIDAALLGHWIMTILCGPAHPSLGLSAESGLSSTINSRGILNRRMRVVQIGANIGDTRNDPLITFLRREGGGLAEAALLEPVPWLFRGLNASYNKEVEGGYVQLMMNAMSTIEGTIDFMAPKMGTTGWKPQMGGIDIPVRTKRHFAKKGKNFAKYFDNIKVKSIHFGTVLKRMGWWDGMPRGSVRQGSPKLPDVIVIDAEGYDKVVLDHILDSVAEIYGDDARIPLIQYEAKHINAIKHLELRKRLENMGYCLSLHTVDVIAVHVTLDNSVHEDKCGWSYS